ncbi:DUF1284 domain-containing protein [Methanobrevibacter sp.]
MIKLRGHHLLCIQGFQGYGYSDKFQENMKNIHKKIMSNEETIQIVTSPDDICEFCPNLNKGQCKDYIEDQKILKMDTIVLDKILNKDNKKEYKPSELFEIVNNAFREKKDIEDVCIGCMWFCKCLWVKQILDD